MDLHVFFPPGGGVFDHFGPTNGALLSEKRGLPYLMVGPRSTLSGYTYEPSYASQEPSCGGFKHDFRAFSRVSVALCTFLRAKKGVWTFL